MDIGLLAHEVIMKAFVSDLKAPIEAYELFQTNDDVTVNDFFNCQIINNRLLPSAEIKEISESIRNTYCLMSDSWNNSKLDNCMDVTATSCQEPTLDYQNIPSTSKASESIDQGHDKETTDFDDYPRNTRADSGIIRFESARYHMLNLMNQSTAFIDGNPLFYDGLKYLVNNLKNTHVIVLDVSNNNLSCEYIEYLENVIRDDPLSSVYLRVSSLECDSFLHYDEKSNKTVLDLSHSNNIKENDLDLLVHTIRDYNIASLDLSNNLIKCESLRILAECLANTEVKSINLSCISLDTDVMHCLAQALKKSQVLSVEFCHSSLNSESMKILASCLEDTKITSINFSGNDLNYDAIACLVAVLPGTEITSIDLSYTTLNSVSLSLLSSCLEDTKITSINLSNNNLDFDAIESLALALPKAHITSLNLSYTSMHCGSLMLIATCLAETKIASLNLSGNLFRFDAINQLAHALQGTEITSINLSRTNLDFECLKAFSSCLKDTKITSLSLRGNAFGNSGVIFLSNALENTSITSIDVGENDLTCTGLKVLASCLIGKEIKSLDLSDNKFGYASIKHLASCLKECEISDLNLSNSSIECNSLKNLVLSLPDTKLRELDLSGNTICCNTFYLAAVLKHTQITKLNLSNNKFGDHSPINFLLRLKTMNHFSLNLSRENNTCSVSFFYLASILKTRDIRFLDLSNTDIDYDELEYLSRGLCGSSVVSLNLSNNKMIRNNAHYLARVLRYTKISSLNLTNTDISRDDFRCLVQGLRGSPVTSLNLSDNQFLDDDCLKYLARNLERTKIIELVLYGMKIDHKTADNILISFVQCETNGCVTIAFDDYVFHRRVNLFRYPGCEIEINQPSLHKGVDNLILLNKGFQKSGITKLIIHDCNQSPEIPHLFGAFDNINIKEIELKMTTLDNYIASMLQKTKIGELKVNSLDLRIAAETKLECISLKFECMTGLNVFDAKTEPERHVSVCHWPVSNNCTVEDQMCLNRRRAESHPNPPLHFENAFFSEIKSFIIASGILYLDLRGINMGYEEFKPLPEALKYSKVISLNLSNNKIGPRCVELLAEVLPLTGIVYIDLEGNDIGLTGFESLMGVFRKTNVCWLSLGGNGIERVLPNYIQLSPFIVPRSDNLISFQIRYLFNELVSLNTSNNSFEFTVPKNLSNPPVSSKHYSILIKHLLETPSYNIHIYDMIYMKSKVHNFNVMKIIDSFITDIENRFINFILEHIEHLKQFFGDDSILEILKTFEYLMVENMVGKLLLHKSLFYVNKEEYILHPFVYKMLHKYGMSLLIEPDKREKIVNFFVNNPEIDGAYELVDLLSLDTFVSHGNTSGCI